MLLLYFYYVFATCLLLVTMLLLLLYYMFTTSLLHVCYFEMFHYILLFVDTSLLLLTTFEYFVPRSTIFVYLFTVRHRLWYSYPVVITTWVHYLGSSGPSTSQILDAFSRFSETFLAEREGGVPRGSSRTLENLSQGSLSLPRKSSENLEKIPRI